MEADQKDLLELRDKFRAAFLEWYAADPRAFQEALNLVYLDSMEPAPIKVA